MRRIARILSDDPDVQDELVQEGLIKLRLADPTRYDLSSFSDRSYLRRSIVTRMLSVALRYWRDSQGGAVVVLPQVKPATDRENAQG